MNQKGEVLIGTFIVVFAACLLAYGVVKVAENCRFYCKLDHPFYPGVSKYGLDYKNSSGGILGPVLGHHKPSVLFKKQTDQASAWYGLKIAKGRGRWDSY